MSYSWLPEGLEEIAEAASLDAALKLAEAFGGSMVYLPHKAGPDHWLVRLVGRQDADRICKAFGGDKRNIPFGPGNGVRSSTRRRLVKELESGASPRQAARRSGVTERTAWRVKAAMRSNTDDDQGRLL